MEPSPPPWTAVFPPLATFQNSTKPKGLDESLCARFAPGVIDCSIIPNTRVPLVKYCHPRANVWVDVNFTVLNSTKCIPVVKVCPSATLIENCVFRVSPRRVSIRRKGNHWCQNILRHNAGPLVRIFKSSKFSDSFPLGFILLFSVAMKFASQQHTRRYRVQGYIEQYPLIRPIAIVLKTLLRQHGLHKPHEGGLGSYAIVLLLYSFMRPGTNALTGMSIVASPPQTYADDLVLVPDPNPRFFQDKAHF